MSMCCDIAINGEEIFENEKGSTCSEIFEYIAEVTGKDPKYGSYDLDATGFAKWLSGRHEAILTSEGARFGARDNLYCEDHMQFMGISTLGISEDEAVSMFNNGKLVFGRVISGGDTLNIFIS